MTSTQQRAELQRQIWQIANDVRGSVDGWAAHIVGNLPDLALEFGTLLSAGHGIVLSK